ncbi:hypothetical protein [Pseudokineococcus lusitanus]|uniref:DUF559 domain-containing protein n=1 Tax=Pseudokineococcus lusitanus TaxID=763993 RepID=A0A3N1HKS9_9ACTN|nr:hypothetical protein [Pseudokineococcus lusitanus]ROP43127.1 hypothetical protein EDC03_1722 [Pseudokineococcus lusitanus]
MADDEAGRFRPFAGPDPQAGLTRGQLRASGYEHLARGVYRAAGGPALTHGDRIAVVRAALVRPVVLGGLSAAWALGAELATADDPVVVVAVPPTPDPRPREGLVVRRCALRREEVVRTALGWATTPVRTAADLLLLEPRVRAVATADAVLRAGGLPPSAVAAALAGRRGARGVAGARGLAPLLDPRAESPRESELRLLLHDAGLPAPEVQLEVRDGDGDFVARLDLGWTAPRVGLEYDGATHRERARHSRDLARHNRLRALGWVVLQVDAAALARPAALLAQLRGLLA